MVSGGYKGTTRFGEKIYVGDTVTLPMSMQLSMKYKRVKKSDDFNSFWIKIDGNKS